LQKATKEVGSIGDSVSVASGHAKAKLRDKPPEMLPGGARGDAIHERQSPKKISQQ
jgi:hypothetical protein